MAGKHRGAFCATAAGSPDDKANRIMNSADCRSSETSYSRRPISNRIRRRTRPFSGAGLLSLSLICCRCVFLLCVCVCVCATGAQAAPDSPAGGADPRAGLGVDVRGRGQHAHALLRGVHPAVQPAKGHEEHLLPQGFAHHAPRHQGKAEAFFSA